MRVLICGSRDWNDLNAIAFILDGLWTDWADGYEVVHLDPFVLIEGGANGADACAAWWARNSPHHPRDHTFVHEQYPADWPRYGRAAGPIRNQQMLDEGKPDVVWAFKSRPDSRGTDDMISRAKSAGIPVYVVTKA